MVASSISKRYEVPPKARLELLADMVRAAGTTPSEFSCCRGFFIVGYDILARLTNVSLDQVSDFIDNRAHERCCC